MRTTKSPNQYRFVLAVILILFMAACAGTKKPPEVAPEVWELARADPQLYISQLAEKRPFISSMAARYKIKMKVENKWYNFKQLALIKYPNLIRLEFSSSFGVAQALMVSNDERVNFYLLKDKHYYTAPPTAESFFKLLGLRLEARDFNDILLNQYLSAAHSHSRSIQWDNKLQLIMIKDQHEVLKREILYYVSPKVSNILIIRILDIDNNQEVLRAHYSNYKIEGDFIFPREINLKVPMEHIEFILQLKDIEFNPKDIRLEFFQFHPHYNATKTDLKLLKEQAAVLLKGIS